MLSKMQGVGKNAFSKVQTIFKVDTDPDLDFYQKLGDNEFENIRVTYGPKVVTDYIYEMEKKLLLKGANNVRTR
jgi:hypothetical protein